MERQAEPAIFSEEQRFTQPWLWLIIVLMTAAVLLPLAAVILNQGQSLNFRTGNGFSVLIAPVICMGIIILFAKLKLITSVNSHGVSVQFKPFNRQPIFFDFRDIKEYATRTYRPIIEYGGWGIKRGIGGLAYNVSGNQGLQLVLADGRKILIGTQKPEQLINAMNSAGKSKRI